MNARIPVRFLLLGLLVLPLAAGFAPGNVVYGAETGGSAQSSAATWTVVIAVLAFAAGFLAGATMAKSGGMQLNLHRHRRHRRNAAGWNRIAQRIQDGTRQGLAGWRSTGQAGDADRDDLSRRIEERILDEMHKHHD